MTERAQITLYLCLATFVIVVFIAGLLVRRHGHTIETHTIREDIKGVRQQMSAHDQATESDIKTIKAWILRILNRFGFLQSKDD